MTDKEAVEHRNIEPAHDKDEPEHRKDEPVSDEEAVVVRKNQLMNGKHECYRCKALKKGSDH